MGKKTKNKKKKVTNSKVGFNQKVPEKERVFADVRLYRIMPIVFLVGVLLLVTGIGLFWKTGHDYKIAQGKKSMPYGTQLPILSGSSDRGTLTLGNSILSKDKKHLAVEIKYDDTAHQYLSAFAKNYRLWLATDQDYDTSGIKMRYGFFGTDGVGVLQLTSNHPFENKAIVALLADHSKLATSQDLNGVSATDDTLDKSITAQLADATSSSSSMADDSSSQKDEGAPIFYARLNPYSAKKVNFNWDENNEVKLVNELFINGNLARYQKEIKQSKEKLASAKKTLREYQKRLKINPNDQVANDGLTSIQNTIDSLNKDVSTNEKNYRTLKSHQLDEDILGKQQTKFKLLKTKNFEYFTTGG